MKRKHYKEESKTHPAYTESL
ncbi:hypothetical protein BN1326_30229 [Staphylococcus argenteus]|uniref:Uncharacterized protein n=1 Tax=Staphylococcus argenteus TaxID=985002 RepID=A0A7U7PX80_9STAP|nr:hypothetical protein BN1326_30229 [Staphylococcus argenteus]CRI21329.1 hypothetical protein BN1326_30229 [Staphylococcus argenteus]